uniref:SH3 domain-containing protein n=1 Tax=Ciona savignyi TaxID=51511 RepID=H2ZQ98_CIOSA
SGLHVLAKAVYDNVAETGDEISFQRGDIITIIEQNTAGLEGWWLCSLNGRQGIAPGNRLRILPGMYDGMQSSIMLEETYDVPPTHYWNSPSSHVDQDEEYDIPRRQPQINRNNNNVGFPTQLIDSPTEIYDIPRAGAWRGDSVDGEEVYDVPQSSAATRNLSRDEEQEVYDVPSNLSAMVTPDPQDLYDVPPIVSRGPQSNENDVYDVPPRRIVPINMNAMLNMMEPEDVYDVPPAPLRLNTSGISNRSAGDILDNFESPHSRPFPTRQESAESDVVYDIPQSSKMGARRNISSGLNSLRRMRREIKELPEIVNDHLPQTINEGGEDYIYDVPPQVSRDNTKMRQNNRLSVTSRESYSSYLDSTPGLFEELKLDVDDAVKQLIETKQKLEDSVSNLLTLVKENWRKLENISHIAQLVQKCFLEIMVAVNNFLLFARGATANAVAFKQNGEERTVKNVQLGLRKQLLPIEEDFDESEWHISKLALEDSTEEFALDAVDSFVMTSRAVSDDASQLANFIHSHIQVLFSPSSPNKSPVKSSPSVKQQPKPFPQANPKVLQARPLPAVPAPVYQPQQAANTVMPGEDAWLEDYDYVALQDKDEFEQSSHETSPISGLNKRRTQFVTLQREIEMKNNNAVFFNPNDKEYLLSLQIDIPNLVQSLSNSIDKFVSSVDAGNPPHSFVPLGKYVIFCAHQFVFAADSLSQQLKVETAKEGLQKQCMDLTAALKRTVVSTKSAALQWPNVSAVQEMVDRTSQIATCAHQLRLTLTTMLSN